MDLKFRDLRADEIDVRIATIKESGLSLLLYKDARVDQDILDETIGAMNWQREHLRDNANCKVGIWDTDKKQWIWKEDTGTESNTEKEKGLASDSFKRACFNWGIGRELYTSPFIWITKQECNIEKNDKGKYECKDNFIVSKIEIENKKIVGLQIKNQKTHRVVFDTAKEKKETYDDLNEKLEQDLGEQKIKSTQEKAIRDLANKVDKDHVIATMKDFGYEKFAEIKQKDYMNIVKNLESGIRN